MSKIAKVLLKKHFKTSLGPDRFELIIFDITGKKIDNPRSRLVKVIIEFSL